MRASDWIKVSDRLPAEDVWVLISQRGINIGIAYYKSGSWWDDMDCLIDEEPIYWMEIVSPGEVSIPITDELLKKNGFTEIWDGKALLYREDIGSVRITKMAPETYCRIELFVNHPSLVILENKIEGVRYMHTLQEMMRMFGFDKSIEL